MKTLSLQLLILLQQWRLAFGYITPTGHLCFYQSAALQTYLTQVETVFEAAQCLWKSTAGGRRAKTDAASSSTFAFLEEWEALVRLRQNTMDFQVLEFVSEPSAVNRKLASLQVDLVSSLTNSACAKTVRRGFQRFQRRACAESLYLQDVPSWTREEFNEKMSPKSITEYHELVENHIYLIEVGTLFGTFDKANKRQFLQALTKVEERWDILYNRCQLLGVLNPDHVERTCAYLTDLGLEESEYHSWRQSNHQKLIYGANAPYCIPDELVSSPLRGLRRMAFRSLQGCGKAMGVCTGWVTNIFKRNKAPPAPIECLDQPFS